MKAPFALLRDHVFFPRLSRKTPLKPPFHKSDPIQSLNRAQKPTVYPSQPSRFSSFQPGSIKLRSSPSHLRSLAHLRPATTHSRPLSTLSPFTPPLVFTGLLLTLWLYKCVMLVVFQNKIIYMPSMPPFSRSEKIADYAAACAPVVWREERLVATDGTSLALAVGGIPDGDGKGEDGRRGQGTGTRRRVVIVYFQGNGSSTPPRLPSLSSVLKLLHNASPSHPPPPRSTTVSSPLPSPPTYTLLALSYRGFWTSTGRPSQQGITLDAAAALSHVAETFPSTPSCETRLVLWGQSLGAAVAVASAANNAADLDRAAGTPPRHRTAQQRLTRPLLPVHGLVLETPFTSIRAMLGAVYPQKWMPYRYLWPFLRNHWDSVVALRRIRAACSPTTSTGSPSFSSSAPSSSPSAASASSATLASTVSCSPRAEQGTDARPRILILQAGRDQVVPAGHSMEIEGVCRELGMDVKRVEVSEALHTDVMAKATGRRAMVTFLREIGSE